MAKIVPSKLAADFSNMGNEVAQINNWGAQLIHFDVMDSIRCIKEVGKEVGYDR